MSLNANTLQLAAKEARGLALDAIAACQSGHLGLPLGCAEIGAVLYGHALNINPDQPRWINRDRFILSAGHGSMFLYSWLHLAGFDLPLDQLKQFRQLHSRTPGHPEFGETDGVECTSGPLGQGVGNAVGMAIAGKMAAARYNQPDLPIFDYHVVALAGDGCLQEGVAAEASSLAGHLGLDNLILIYDSNDITLDAPANASQSEDTATRYTAYGFDVQQVDGHDMHAFLAAYESARHATTGKPQLIIAKTEAGRGIPEVAGTFKAHGEAGVKFVASARQHLGLPQETFYVSEDTRTYFEGHKLILIERYKAWQKRFETWQKKHPALAQELANGYAQTLPQNLLENIAASDPAKPIATRAAAGIVLNAIAQAMPHVISGSADLHGSTRNYLDNLGNFTRDNPRGRNLLFGIREHAMGAIMNGIAYDGLFRISGATFLTFSDYMRPSVRLAALTKLPVTYIWTHDSIGVGEDGPTHQPVETVSSLRLIPNLDVIRPADAEETAAALVAAMQRTDGPTALILSRQNLPLLKDIPLEQRRQGTLRGAYIARREKGPLKTLLLSCGSELEIALAAAAKLGDGVRVVSMPCMERFERQDAAYREEVLPSTCTHRIAIEAGVTSLWWKYTGTQGKVIGIDRFGMSAPAPTVYRELGITQDALVAAAQSR